MLLLIAPCTDSGDVRLGGGSSTCNGALEMKHQGDWRLVLAWFDWNRMSSSIVCRQLDCGSAVSTEFTSTSTRASGWMIPSSCVGSESSLAQCGAVKSHHGNVTLKVNCSGTAMSYNNVQCLFCFSSSTGTEHKLNDIQHTQHQPDLCHTRNISALFLKMSNGIQPFLPL